MSEVILVGELFGQHVILVQTKSVKKKNQKVTRVAVMDVHEERALDEGASATNSQSEADVGERSGQPQQSQTPPLRSAVASDADDEKEEDREEETSGTLWGHASLPQSVYNRRITI